jgi:hypoxia up-regulated 1
VKRSELPWLGKSDTSKRDVADVRCSLTSIASFESAKHSREEARNLLEGYLYRLQNFLSPDSDNKALRAYSTEEERTKLSNLLAQTFEWLGDNAEKADEKTLRAKRTELM